MTSSSLAERTGCYIHVLVSHQLFSRIFIIAFYLEGKRLLYVLAQNILYIVNTHLTE